MQAVILTAGNGTRMAKHYEGPKQLLPLLGKPVIEHTLHALPAEVTEFICVVGGPHEERIRDHFGKTFFGRPVSFVRQEKQLGLADAFRTARPHVRGRWLGLVGDDVFGAQGIKDVLRHDLGILAARVERPEQFGVLVTDEDSHFEYGIEKPKEFISDLVFTGMMVMDESFFDVETEPSARGEYEVVDVWGKLVRDLGKKIKVVESDLWMPINDREQLAYAERHLADAAVLARDIRAVLAN
ncbi:nucleotidyltransferase family protein [bacterium]|nr:nucleotidyltransferase family protein [bacterium]